MVERSENLSEAPSSFLDHGVAKPMGSTFSDCYEGSESTHESKTNANAGNDTGRSDLYHASWDPSEAGKYHTDSSQKAAADNSLEEVDEKDK